MDRKLIRKRDREPARNMDRAALADEDLERVAGGVVSGEGVVCPKCGWTIQRGSERTHICIGFSGDDNG